MNVTVSFKCPDAVSWTREQLGDADRRKFDKIAKKYFEFDEYCYVRVNLDTGKVEVLPVKE